MLKKLSKLKAKILNYKLFKPISQSENDISTILKKRKIFRFEMLYIIGTIFYLLSLHHINGYEMSCFYKEGVKCLFMIAKLIFISSIFFSLSIFMIIYKNYKKINLLYIILIFIFFILIDHNNDIIKHGLFNFIGLSLMTILLFIFLCFLSFLIHLFTKGNFLRLTIILSFLIVIYKLAKYYKSTHFSCVDWDKGLNNTYIDNLSKNYPCKINIPKPHSCYLSEIGSLFDFSSKYRPTCSDNKLLREEKIKFHKYYKDLNYSNISENSHFGFPITNTDKYNPYYFGNICFPGKKNFFDTVNENIILMDLYNKNKSKYYPDEPHPEVEVIFEGEKGKIIINIKRNETLIKERNNINKNNQLYKNVLIIFLDTVSRAHFIRKMPKTIKFLNNFTKYEANPLKKNMTTFQFLKYNSLNIYTDPNLKAAYYGGTINGNGTHFANYFKSNGFITGRVSSFCEKEGVADNNFPISFNHNIFDHEGLSLGCIKTMYDGPLLHIQDSLIRKCLFGKDLNIYAFKYLESFWNEYNDQKKMFIFQTLEGHEPTGQLIGYFDDVLFEFLNKFYNKGYFNNTAIIIFSDHGQHLTGPLYLLDSYDFYYERTLPVLFLILPNEEKLYKNNLYDNISSNQQTFITAFDIYNTLVNLAFGEDQNKINKYKTQYGESLFNKIDYNNRYCQSNIFNSQIVSYACNCKKQ